MTDAPRITDAEATAVYKRVLLADDEQDLKPNREGLETVRQALAAFLRARVPERAVETETTVVRGKQVTIHYCEDECKGFNACRDLVLKGRE